MDSILNQISDDSFLSPSEAAEYLNVGVSTIYRYLAMEKNGIPHYKVSAKNIRISKRELDEWMKTFRQ